MKKNSRLHGDYWRLALAGGGGAPGVPARGSRVGISSKPEKRCRRLRLECLESRTLLSAGPTVATPAAVSPSATTGTAANLSVLGADADGKASLTYTWATIGTPPAPVVFSSNGTNAAKNTVATFTQAGAYNFAVTIVNQGGLSVISTVSDPVSFGLFNNSVNVGSPALAGSMSYNTSSAAYTVNAGGTDIWGTSDQFRYTYEGFQRQRSAHRPRHFGEQHQFRRQGGGDVPRLGRRQRRLRLRLRLAEQPGGVRDPRRDGATASYSATASPGGSPVWLQLDRSGANDNQFSRLLLPRRRQLDASGHDADGDHGRQCPGGAGGDQPQHRGPQHVGDRQRHAQRRHAASPAEHAAGKLRADGGIPGGLGEYRQLLFAVGGRRRHDVGLHAAWV